MLFNAWKCVSSLCVARCFLKAGFAKSLTKSGDDIFDPEDDLPLHLITTNRDSDIEDDDDIPLADLMKLYDAGVEADDFANVDRDVMSVESLGDEDIVNSVINADEPSDDDDDDDDEGMEETEAKITTTEARDCFQKIETYIEKAENTPDTVFKAMNEINNFLKKQENTMLKQPTIKDFYSK